MNDEIGQGGADAAQEAREALEAVGEMTARTKRAMWTGGGDFLFIVWGAVWIIGYSMFQFFPKPANTVWNVLLGCGILASVIIFWRMNARVKGAVPGRLILFWILLSIYAAIWLYLLKPYSGRQVGTFIPIVVMFAYVVMGLWGSEPLLLWIGLLVTALILVGYIFAGAWMALWLAVFGGGTLFATGLYIRLAWRS